MVAAHPAQPTADRVRAAMAATNRPPRDANEDDHRRPAEVLEFLRVDEGMTVLDVNPDDGYYAELLAAAVGPDGLVYTHDAATPSHHAARSGAALDERLANGRLPNVVRHEGDLGDPVLAHRIDAAFLILGLNDFYNTHGDEPTIELLRRIAATLKPEGVLGIVDYVGEQPRSLDNFAIHTAERIHAESALTAAGFAIDAESDALKERGLEFQGLPGAELARRRDRFVIRARLRR